MRRPTRSALAMIAAGVLALTAACGDDGEEGADSPTTAAGDAAVETIEEGKLTVCSDIPYAPFEFEENGEVVGIDADLMKEVAERLDLEAEFRDTDFDGIFSALAAKRCDVIASSVSITEERKENNAFTKGYFAINQSLLVRKEDAAKYDDLASLRGRTIGVQSETTGAAYAEENASGATIREFTGADDLFTALKAKQVDAALQDLPVNSYNAETTGDTEVVEVFTAAEKEEYGFVLRPDDDELLEAIDEQLAAMREDGTYDEILEKYLGEDAPSADGDDGGGGSATGGSGSGSGTASTTPGGGSGSGSGSTKSTTTTRATSTTS